MNIIPGTVYKGKVSYFGGPNDTGVSPTEGLALYNKHEENEALFLNYQPEGTSGLARRLDPNRFYCAMRFNYEVTPKSVLRKAQVKITFQGKSIYAQCADWGPHERTNRICDVSPGVMKELGCKTDDEVECELIL